MAGKYITISPDGKVEIKEAKPEHGNKPRLEFVQGLVGGFVERVPLDNLEDRFIDMYGDEEALIKANPVFNKVATDFDNRCIGFDGFHLCGSFAFVAYADDKDGNTDWAWLDEKQVTTVMQDFGLASIAAENERSK